MEEGKDVEFVCYYNWGNNNLVVHDSSHVVSYEHRISNPKATLAKLPGGSTCMEVPNIELGSTPETYRLGDHFVYKKQCI